MAGYQFVTVWRVQAPLPSVWDEIYHPEHWPTWWKGVESVVELRQGDERGVGSLRRFTWKSKLPYRLSFEMETTRVEPLSLIEGVARGELDGIGCWQFSSDGPVTVARYDWRVETTKRWMILLEPLARPLFRWNHDVIMGWGAEGLSKRLGASLTHPERR
jgi:hypothetical protein